MNIIQKLAKVIFPYQVKIELALLFLLILGMTLTQVNYGFLLIILPLSLLSMMYYFLTFRKVEHHNAMNIFANKIMSISFSVAMIGILFSIQRFPNSKMMLLVALVGMAIGLIMQIIVNSKEEKKELLDITTLRVFIIAGLVVYFMVYGNTLIAAQ